jgi:hypothetical protein
LLALDIRLEKQRKKDMELESLRIMVLEDEKFQPATNHPLRMTYENRLFELHPKYREILREAGYTMLESFFDETWKIFKANT